MSIQVYTASTIEPLAKQLAKEIKKSESSVFHSDFIVSGNNALVQWLKVKIAEENGIAANLVSCSAKDVLSIVYKIIGGKDENKSVLNDFQQKWIIYELLSSDEFKETFSGIANYYLDKPSYQIALADKLSTLFNQYSLYMPDKLESWNSPEFSTIDTDEEWQQRLWQAFQKKINVDDFLDDFQLFQFIKKQLKDAEKQNILKEKLPVIYLFNISDFNKYLLELFIEIGGVIDVKIFYTSTVREIKTSYTNDLVQSLKGTSVYILEAFRNKNISIEWLDDNEHEAPNTLLQSLQNTLISDENLKEIKEPDFSLTINACYSPIREVEVLYNYLVKSVDSSKNNIGARDIAVYCSDLDKYAPAISAVFENAPYSFPYHIASEKEQTVNSSINALDAILNIDIRWMKPSLVMQLLEYPSIIQKYEFEDVDLLRKLVKDANIRNGFSGDKENETNLISWVNGLKRLCYGMLIAGEEWFNDGNDEYLLIDKVEGNSANDLVRLNYFVHNLHFFLSELKKERSLGDWILFLQDGLDLFFNKENDFQLEHLTRELAGIDLVASSVHKINFETFYPLLTTIFNSIDTSSLIGTNKGIRFSSVVNASPVPNKVIALLGLNLSDFPRQTHRLSYDLIKSNPESVLQDIREKDKSFFLKMILSAKDQLYISYLGNSSKNNSKLPPSSLVDTLLDYLDIEKLVKEHPLHNFNSKYFDNTKGYYSYLGKNKEDKDDIIFDKSNKSVEDNRKIIEIPLHELINFFKDSFKYYYNKKLQIYYREESEALEDSEPFALDKLQEWTLKKIITENPELTLTDLKTLKAQGNLPLGTYGEISLENLQEELNDLTNKIEELKTGFTEKKVKINYEIEINQVQYKVRGEIDSVFVKETERVHIYLNVSSSQQKYQFEAFINFLFLNQSKPTRLEFLFMKKVYKKPSVLKCHPINYSEGFNYILKEIMTLFVASKKNLNPFYINENVAKPLLEIETDNITKEAIESALEKDAFLSDYVRKEQESRYFDDPDNRKRFVENYQLLNKLIFQNFN